MVEWEPALQPSAVVQSRAFFWRLFLIFLIFLISWYSWTSWYSRTSWSLDNLEFLDLKLLILLILLISWYCWNLYILGLLDLEFWARVSYLCAKKNWSFVQVYFGLAGARSGRRNWRGSCLSKSIRSISEQHDSTRFRSFTVPVLVDAAARYLCVRTEPWSVQPAALGFTQPQGSSCRRVVHEFWLGNFSWCTFHDATFHRWNGKNMQGSKGANILISSSFCPRHSWQRFRQSSRVIDHPRTFDLKVAASHLCNRIVERATSHVNQQPSALLLTSLRRRS